MAGEFEGWTDEPLDAFPPAPASTPEADPTAGWEEVSADHFVEPVVAQAAPQPGDIAGPVGSLSDPYRGQRLRYEAERAAENDLIRMGFKAEAGGDPALQDLRVAKHFGIPLNLVQVRRAEWLDTFAKADGDPEAWRAQYPLSAKLVLEHPELADHIVANKELNVVLQGWNKVADFVTDALRPVNEVLASHPELQPPGVVSAIEAMGEGALVTTPPPSPEDEAARRAKRDAPRPAIEVDSPEAVRIRAAGVLEVTATRAGEAQAQLEVLKLYSGLMQARARGLDTTGLEMAIYDAEQKSVPLHLGEEGWRQVLSEAVGGSMSTLDVLKNVAKRGGTGALAGYAAGALITKSPVGAAAGARAGGSFGAKYGAAEGSFILESGDSYRQLLTTKTDSGKLLTEEEARGGAIIAATIKTGIELAELSVLLKALGPAGGVIRGGGLEAVKEMLATNPGFRALAVRAAKAWVAEGLEEGAQEATDEGVAYLVRSKSDEAMQAGPVFNPEAIKESLAAGIIGGGPFAAGALVVATTTHALSQSKQGRGALQVAELAKVATDPSAQAMADEVAALIEAKTAETGDDTTHVYVDPGAFTRLFQSPKEAEQAIATLVGEEGPQRLAEAASTGTKLEVPLADYIAKWGRDGLAEKLVDDTATQAGHQTARELKANAAENEAKAQEIAAQATAPEVAVEKFSEVEAQLVAAGHSKANARAQAGLWTHFARAAEKAFGVDAEQLFKDVKLQIERGDILKPAPEDALEQAPTAEQLARDINVDFVTHLRTFAGWEASPRQEGKEVAVLTIPDIKAVNDDPAGGHGTANGLLRHIAPAIARADPEAARKGTNFLFHGSAAELAGVLAEVQRLLPSGMRAVGVTAATTEEAFKALDKSVDAQRAAGTLPGRGATAFDLKTLAEVETTFPVEPGLAPNIAKEMVEAAAAMTPEKAKAVYHDAVVPGLLSAAGWNSIERKPFVASIDLKGLKLVNEAFYDKAAGDQVIAHFGKVAVATGAHSVDMAHLSGDEYAIQADTQEDLDSFLDDLDAELRKKSAFVTMWGRTYPTAVRFRDGIGESYGAADRKLNAAKRAEPDTGADRPRAARQNRNDVAAGTSQDGNRGVATPGSDVLAERRARIDARGIQGPDFFNRPRVGREDSGGDSEGDGRGDGGLTLYEQNPQDAETIARVRAGHARMKNKTAQAWVTKQLDFILAGRQGKRPGPGGLSDAQRSRLSNELLRDGFPDPDLKVNPDGSLSFPSTGVKTAKQAAKKGKGKSTQSFEERENFRRQMAGELPLDKSKLFQSAKEKNLIVQHNLTGPNLVHASDLGGLAAPSLAVANHKSPLSGFGEISLLAPSSMVDPKKGTPVYDADVYSPRHPEVRNKLITREVSKLEKWLQPFAKTIGGSSGELSQVLEQNGASGGVDNRALRSVLEAAFLSEKGIETTPPMRKVRSEHPLSEHPALVSFFKERGVDNQFDAGSEYHQALSEAFKKAAHELEKSSEDPGLAGHILSDYLAPDGLLSFGRTHRLMRDAVGVGGMEVDKYAFEDLLQKQVDDIGRPEFEKWAKEKLGPAVGEAYIRKVGDTGRVRRLPYTLENVLREVTKKIRQGESFNYGLGTARAAGAKRFASIEQIQKARNRVISKEEFNKEKDANSNRFGLLVEKMNEFHSAPGSFGVTNALASAIGESYKRGRSLRAELERDGFKDVPPEALKDVADFAADLLAMPTEYFEAKPQRIIALQEFTAAVVPSDASPEVLSVLKKHGLDVTTYEKGNETARAKAVQDAAASSGLLFQSDIEGGAPRGYTEFAQQGLERLYRIVLNPSADLSTFIHESAHVFLEMFGDLAARADAPEQVRADYATALKWLGVETQEQLRLGGDVQTSARAREAHEKWARGFEAYLRTGKAPTSELAGAFHRFSLWLQSVYRSVRHLNVEVSSDIAGVFDRLLATDDEIQAQRAKTPSLFSNAEEAGMAPAQWLEYLEAQAQATSHATTAANFAALKDKLREAEAWWKEEITKHAEAASAEYEALPARRAQLVLQGKMTEDFFGLNVALDRKAVEGMVGEAAARKFRLAKEGGVHPDEVSEMLGYATGAEMMKAVEVLPPKATWAKQMADFRMRERYPDVVEDKTRLREVVAKGLHGDQTERWLVKELQALGSRVNVEAVKRAATIITEGRKVGSLNPGEALRGERRAAQAALKAAAKKDFAQAAVFKQQQLLNMHLFRELSKAKEEREAFLELADELSKLKSRQRLGKASPVYRDGVDLLLETFELKEPEPGRAKPLTTSLTEVVTQMQLDAATVAFDAEEINALAAKRGLAGWKSLDVAGMRKLVDALKNIRGAARARSTVILDEKRADRDVYIPLLVEEIQRNLPSLGLIASSKSAETVVQSIGGVVAGVDGSLLRIETMVKWLGGRDLKSLAYRLLIEPMQQAKHREADLLKSTVKPIIDAFEKMPAAVKRTFNDRIDGAKLFPQHQVALEQNLSPPTRRFELLMMALNAGNESNLERLLVGRNITADHLQAALSLLTKEEMDWVQSVWDATESLWPEAAALEERDSGVAPPKLKLKPLVVNDTTYRGGYFPAIYDKRVEAAGERQAAQQVADLMDPSFSRPGTTHGHLKSRAENFSGALQLEPNAIPVHLAQVVHDIAFREAVKSVGGLVLDKEVQAVLKDRLGERSEQFLQWVKDVGQMRGVDGAVRGRQLMNLVRKVRANTIIGILGYSATTALGDLSNPVAGKFRSDIKAKHWAAGLLEFMASPRASIAAAEAKSGELRFRRDEVQRNLHAQIKRLTATGPLSAGPVAAFKQHAFAFLEFTDVIGRTPLWMGAYRQALAAEKSEVEAVSAADAVVRENFPSHSAVDAAALLRDKGYWGATLMFYGYFNVTYNAYRDMGREFLEADGSFDKLKTAGRILAFASATAVLAELLAGRGREDDEEWGEWYLRKLLSGFVSSVPFGGDVALQVESKVLGKRSNPRQMGVASAVAALGEAFLNLPNEEKDADKRLKALLRAAAPFTGIPTIQPIRTVGALFDIATGESEVRNPADLISDVVYGRREGQPDNLMSMVGDVAAGGTR